MTRYLAVAILGLSIATAAVADQVILPRSWNGVPLSDIENSIAASKWPVRDVDLESSAWAKYLKFKRVRVFGSFTDDEVDDLLAHAESRRSARFEAVDHKCGAAWDIYLRGNPKFARIEYAQNCDANIPDRFHIVFGRTASGWQFIYAREYW